MKIQVLEKRFPYNRVGQVLTVNERVGLELIDANEKNLFKPTAKKITEKQAEKILQTQHDEEKNITRPGADTALEFLVNVLPYKKGEIATFGVEQAELFIRRQQAKKYKVENKRK